MSLSWALSMALAMAVGLAAVAACWPAWRQSVPSLVFSLGLSWGLGLGITSLLFAACQLAAPGQTWLSVTAELAVLAAAVVCARRGREIDGAAPRPAGERLVIRAIFGTLAGFAAVLLFLAVVDSVAKMPLGSYDAIRTWNLKARHVVLGGPDWWRYWLAPEAVHSHTNYPLLSSLSIARLWVHAGEVTQFTSMALAVGYALATLGSLWGALALLAGAAPAALGVAGMVSTHVFVQHSAWQYVDAPVGYQLASSVALMILVLNREGAAPWRLWLLAGLAAGTLGWMKNEGTLLCALLMIAAWLVALLRDGARPLARALVTSGLGLAPFALAVIAVKIVGGAFDQVPEGQGIAGFWLRVGDGQTHRRILRFAAFVWQQVPSAVVLLCVVGYVATAGLRRERSARWVMAALAGVLACQLLAYYTVYLMDLPKLIRSMPRFFLQVWPGMLLLVLWAGRPATVASGGERVAEGAAGSEATAR